MKTKMSEKTLGQKTKAKGPISGVIILFQCFEKCHIAILAERASRDLRIWENVKTIALLFVLSNSNFNESLRAMDKSKEDTFTWRDKGFKPSTASSKKYNCVKDFSLDNDE